MNRHFRFALILLLLAALPVQGFSAASMLFCGLNSQPDGVSTNVHAHHHTVAVAGHDETPAHGNHAASCAKCMSCCIGAMMPPSAFIPVATMAVNSPPAVRDPTPPAIPDLRAPYHPPRSRTA